MSNIFTLFISNTYAGSISEFRGVVHDRENF